MVRTRNVRTSKPTGSALVLAVLLLVILSLLGLSMLKAAQDAQEYSIQLKRKAAAQAAAEAAYEQAVFWMSQQPDLFVALEKKSPQGTVSFPDSSGSYQIRFSSFADSRPIFEVRARGQSGQMVSTLNVFLVQAMTGWEMGQCRVPSGPSSTAEVYFANGEIIAMPIHINTIQPPDDRNPDIYVQPDPLFLEPVSMSESRYASDGTDKYRRIIDLFDSGIFFDQPKSRISDEEAVQLKFDWFVQMLQEQKPNLIFRPVKNNLVPLGQPAVQLEFFVGTDNIGYVRITNNCTVRGYQRTVSDTDTWDYKIKPGSGGTLFEKYPVYGFHYIPANASAPGQQIVLPVQNTYVVPRYGSTEGPPGGQIFVDGNVIIGSASETASLPNVRQLNTVQGKITVAATGHIWVAAPIQVSDRDDSGASYPRQANGLPHPDNPNALGLVARGVVKIIDPGLAASLGAPGAVSGAVYQPVAVLDKGQPAGSPRRHLPDPMIVEAAVTACGGGWGAENVERNGYGGRKEEVGPTDNLIVRGMLAESIRGVVGVIGRDGYVKQYYLDERLSRGIVPGNLWFKGKYIPIPGGWKETAQRLP